MQEETNGDSREVFDDHLQLAQEGSFEEDITKNFSPDCIVLTSRGTFRGFEGLLQLARMLEQEIPNARYCYNNRLDEGRVAIS